MTITKFFSSLALSFTAFSLHVVTDLGHTYKGKIEGVTFCPRAGGEVFFPLGGKANCFEASPLSSPSKHAYAMLVPGIDKVGP